MNKGKSAEVGMYSYLNYGNILIDLGGFKKKMKIMKVIAWIIFILSLIWSSFLLISYISTEVDLDWDIVFFGMIPIS